MSSLNVKQIKSAAGETLQSAAMHPKKLALIHSGIVAAATLAVTILNYLLQQQMTSTGGLSGMDTRAILSTAQSMLTLAVTVLLPFWEIGFLYACLGYARKQQVGIPTLTEGLRRFFPVLRLNLIQGVIYIALSVAALQIGSFLFMLTPFSEGVVTAMDSILSTTDAALSDETLIQLITTAAPIYLFCGVIALVLIVPMSYRFRMAGFYLLDKKERRALAAIAASSRMMRYNRFALFRLDLSYWWYYAAAVLLGVIGNLDVTLAAAGIPIGAATPWICYGVYLAGQLLLAWFAAAKVQTSYAVAYDILLPEADPVNPTATFEPGD